jgi:cytochrome c biogenesis protein CcdA/thioredoxin-related protein
MYYIRIILSVILPIVFINSATAESPPPTKNQAIRILVFYDENCNNCETLKNDLIPMLERKYGIPIEAKYIEVNDLKTYNALLSLEKRYNDTANDFPVIFVGKYILGGPKEIEQNFESAVKDYVYLGGCDIPQFELETQPTIESKGKIYIAFFDKHGCKHCDRTNHILKNLQRRCPNLEVKSFYSINKQDAKLQEAICIYADIPKDKRLIAPTVMIEKDYLIKNDITDDSIEKLVAKYLRNGSRCVWEDAKDMELNAEKGIIQRFRSIGIFAVIGAGLIDGINPCAFATIILLLSNLALVGRKKRELLYTGAAFTGAVFITYLSLGLGAFQFIYSFSALSILRHIFYAIATSVAIAFGIFSIYDYYQVKRGNIKKIKLQLPKSVKDRIHNVIRQKTRARNFILAAFVGGFIISILELACTGQMYLPTIVFVSSMSEYRVHSILLLIIYNIMFVLPLIAIFILGSYGITSEQLLKVMLKYLDKTKLAIGCIFFTIGTLLILTWAKLF